MPFFWSINNLQSLSLCYIALSLIINAFACGRAVKNVVKVKSKKEKVKESNFDAGNDIVYFYIWEWWYF